MVGGGVLALALAMGAGWALGRDHASPAAPTNQNGSATESDLGSQMLLAVEITTDNRGLARHNDDGTCTWHTLSYVLRDGAGTILDLGDVPMAGPGKTAIGEIRDGGLCRLPVSLGAPPTNVYEVEIAATVLPWARDRAADDSYSGSAMISRRDAQEGEVLAVFIDGPPAVY